MPEIAWILLAAVLAVLIAMAGTVMGWLLGRRSVVVPVYRGYDPEGPGEETVEVRTSDPESVAVAEELASEPEPEPSRMPADFGTGFWPVKDKQRLNPLEDQTVPVSLRYKRVKPYRWPGPRHGAPEPICREVDQLGFEAPFAIADEAVLDWSAHTGEMDGVSG